MNKQVLTMKGYDMFEVISAFQKSIRRGLEDDAMFWGVELYNSGFIPLCLAKNDDYFNRRYWACESKCSCCDASIKATIRQLVL